MYLLRHRTTGDGRLRQHDANWSITVLDVLAQTNALPSFKAQCTTAKTGPYSKE